VPEPSAFEFEMVTEKLKRHKSPGIDRMLAGYIASGGRKIVFGIKRIAQRSGRNQSLYVSIGRVVKQM
jgi:hypothetical protein